MQESHAAQSSTFNFYSQTEHGQMLSSLSGLLDKHPQMLSLFDKNLSMEADFRLMNS